MLNALKALGIAVEDVAAMTVFTTENDVEIIRQAAQDARTQDHDWLLRKGCKVKNTYRECELMFQANDYRDDTFIATPTAKAQWKVPATVWLPKDKEGPFPVIVFGHGINGSRSNGHWIANWVCPEGFAVIAAPAMKHGSHPTALGTDTSQAAVVFLGFDLKTVTFHPMQLRGNMNQTEMDRLQMIATMIRHPDVDGDGEPDLDTDKIAYWGISLGSLQAPGLIAMEDHIRAGVLSVGGGRLMLFATTGDNVKQLKPFIIKLAGSEERFNRLVVPVQSLVDAGDPDTYAPHILKDRYSGDAPSILFPAADQDDVVPPACAHALAQALGIPQMRPVFTPVPGLTVLDSPVRGNLYDGNVTAAYFQFDRVTWSGKVEPAKHNNTPGSPEAALQALHFLDTWMADGIGEIIDPYAELNTPPLPAEDQ
jgi:dienelactone hydrolase